MLMPHSGWMEQVVLVGCGVCWRADIVREGRERSELISCTAYSTTVASQQLRITGLYRPAGHQPFQVQSCVPRWFPRFHPF